MRVQKKRSFSAPLVRVLSAFAATTAGCQGDDAERPLDGGALVVLEGRCPLAQPESGAACTGSLSCSYNQTGYAVRCVGGRIQDPCSGGCNPPTPEWFFDAGRVRVEEPSSDAGRSDAASGAAAISPSLDAALEADGG